MLPERALVDKPSANPDLMSHREYGSVRETEAYWKALWSIALTLAVEKHLGVCPELSGPLEKLVRNEHLRSACDLFTNLLALPRDAYFAAFKDYVAHLLPVFRRIHSSIAMFIDNIDEYFEDFLASDLVDSEEQRGDLPQLLALRPGRHRARGARPARDQQPRQDLRLDPQGGVPAHASWATRWACSSPARRSTCTTRARI